MRNSHHHNQNGDDKQKKSAESPQLTSVENPPSSVMEDAVTLLFTDDRLFAPLAAWIEEDLARLEERFAPFHTADSQQGSKR
jgi:hypothetical protein